MRNVSISILLFLSVAAIGQVTGRFAFSRSTSAVTPPVVYTDDFDAHDVGDLDGEGYWVVGEGALKVNDSGGGDNIVNPFSSGAFSAYYYSRLFANDQYSKATIVTLGTGVAMGVCVRWSTGDDGYYVYSTDAASYLRRRNNGSNTTLATGDPWSATDVVELRVIGYELQVYVNDALDTSIDTDGKYDDSGSPFKIASGKAGLAGFGNSLVADLDDWEGGNL